MGTLKYKKQIHKLNAYKIHTPIPFRRVHKIMKSDY